MSLRVDQANAALVVATTYPVLAVAYYSAARDQLDDVFDRIGPGWQARIVVPKWAQRGMFGWITRFLSNTRPAGGSSHGLSSVPEAFTAWELAAAVAAREGDGDGAAHEAGRAHGE